MREIKFRAWSWLIEQMYYLNPKSGFDIRFLISDKDNVVMQYTGLKDKNGKEIYEGDIVKDCDGIIWKVHWSLGGFNLFCSSTEMERAIQIKPKKHKEQELIDELGMWWVECEVIGNKFENPELKK